MSKHWRDKYADKVVPAAAAVRKIRTGDRVFIGSACGEPQELARALADVGSELTDTEVMTVLTLGARSSARVTVAVIRTIVMIAFILYSFA